MSIILKTNSLTKYYGPKANRTTACQNITLSIEKGSFVVIIGKSGSGKSTLLHMLGGLCKPSKGEVLLEGKPLYQMKDDQLSRFRRRRIGFVFQFFNLIPDLNVIENILLPLHLDHLKEDRNFVDEIIDFLDLSEKREAFINELSGGQRQRVALARALASKPAIILADEPTGNLDARNSNEVAKLLKLSQRKYHQTVILVTHDQTLAEIADRVITIQDGKIMNDEIL